MSEDLKQHVEALILKAGKAEAANEALHFSQAALNIALATFTLHPDLRRKERASRRRNRPPGRQSRFAHVCR